MGMRNERQVLGHPNGPQKRVHLLREPQALRGGGCLQGHWCCCYSVHCPTASCCYGNRPFCASHVSAWQCPMVELLGATELIWKAFQSPHLEHWKLFIFLARSSKKKIIPPGQTQLALLTLGHWGNSSLDQDMEAQGPVTTGPPSPHYRLRPPGGTAHPTGRARQEREAGPCGRRKHGSVESLPSLRHFRSFDEYSLRTTLTRAIFDEYMERESVGKKLPTMT